MRIRIGFVSVVNKGVRESRKREAEIFEGKSAANWGANVRVDANPDDEAMDVWLDEKEVPRVIWYCKWDDVVGSFHAERKVGLLSYEGEMTPMDVVRTDLFHKTHGCDPVFKADKFYEDRKDHPVEVWAELDGVESNHLVYKVS